MRFRSFFIPIALFIAVAISVTLSVILWTNPANYRTKENTTKSTTTNVYTRSKQYLYVPNQAVVNNSDGTQDILGNKSENAVSAIRATMQNYKNVKMSVVSRGSKSKFLKIGKRPNSFLLNYTGPVSMKIVNEIVNNRFKQVHNYTINRIVLPTNDSTKIYLLNDSKHNVYQIKVKKHSLANLKKVSQLNLKRVPATLQLLNGSPIMFVKQPVQMQTYKYLVNNQEQDFYVSRLLKQNYSQDINVKKRKAVTTYSDQNSHQLAFNNTTKMVEFTNYNPNSNSRSITNIINESYKQLNTLGIPLDNVRYFTYNPKRRVITYRMFVEGFPIFRGRSFGVVSMQTVNNSTQKTVFSLSTPQVPLPSSHALQSIPSSYTVLKRLVNSGYDKRKITQIKIGYHWENSTTKTVIKLVPDWYILYNNKWQNLTNMLNQY